ncbi:MAG TPA: hypothetical protein H9955_00660 [Candidatus Mediterraneibacter cottocaccae]|nr:hypothetical protein [Candidatus Mediterraneibacter cottocaccae]
MGKLIQLKSFSQISVDCGNYDFLENPTNNTIFVISSLLHVMNAELCIEHIPSTIISFFENAKAPVCNRKSGLIILAANPNSWNQLAYQLAHEMCHRAIPNDVVKNLRWLEESICELSSYYFLPHLSKHWRRKNVNLIYAKTNKPYYPAFEKYVKDARKKAIELNLSSFSVIPPSDELQSLIDDCEIREKNAYIATSLLPIFYKYPCTWHAVPLLGTLSPDLSLEASLIEWIELSPEECRIGLRKIAKIFGIELPQK